MDIVYVYTKERQAFGKHCADFRDRKAEANTLSEIRVEPNATKFSEYIVRNPTSVEVLQAPESSEHEVLFGMTLFGCDRSSRLTPSGMKSLRTACCMLREAGRKMLIRRNSITLLVSGGNCHFWILQALSESI